MTPRRLLILTLVALLAIVGGLLLANRQTSSGSSNDRALLYPDLRKQLDAVKSVRLYKAGDALGVELVHGDAGWTVSERSGYAADREKLGKLLLGLAEAKLFEEKTSNPESYATLGVEDTKAAAATGIRVELAGTATPVNLIVGKPSVGGQSTYVRRAGEAKSWLVTGTLEAPTTPDAWLHKDVIDVAADRVQAITVTTGAAKAYTAAKAARTDTDFAVEGLPKGKELATPGVANSTSSALVAVTLADVHPAKEFESTPPSAHATLKTFDGLVADLDGWVRNDKHYIAVKPSFDATLAEHFKPAATPPAPAPRRRPRQIPRHRLRRRSLRKQNLLKQNPRRTWKRM